MTNHQIPKELQPGATIERSFQIAGARNIDEEARTVEVAFSSEFPGERFWGVEILDHSPGSMRTERLLAGGAVLVDHDSRDHVGVVVSARTDADRVGRATLRFGRSARASEIFQDVIDGIRPNVSVRYQIHEAVLEKVEGGSEIYRITDWEPLEISIVSVPFDPTVGVGRGRGDPPSDHPRSATMADQKDTPAAKPDAAASGGDNAAERRHGADAEHQRASEIIAIGEAYASHGADKLIPEAIRSKMSVDAFRAKVLEHLAKEPKPSADVGMSDKEVRQYSFVRALHALANPTDMRAREAAAFEFEVGRAAAEKSHKEARGLIVPFDVLRTATEQRELVVGTPTAGGHLVATDLLSGSFIELLRNAMVINGLGTRFLTGLVGNIAVPKQTGGGTMAWVTEGNAPSASDQAFAQVAMSPKTAAARTQISRKLLLQSSIDIENFVRQDLATVVGLGIQQAAINGSGASGQPRGILNTSGIGSVVGGTNGAAPDWEDIVDLETEVSVANADVGSLAYLTNAKVRGKLKKTFVDGPGTGERVWQPGETPLNGYRAAVTNAVPGNGTKGTGTNLSAIIFGNFADLIIGMWGGLDLQVDPYSAGDSGAVIVRAFQDVDVAARHAESFAAMTDAITA
ncbi:phage major capsid protein [Luteimonas sp. JM171]|uniref:phage major capsid protein n=1 Tax=Luteimonas sp. JM171 TaxID=1896164 RepID=UPI0008587A50|nr:phage major capsid protein [Luteimonas sp. JM171]AOH36873.1 capsid protein [Luteimonas sp. JM171]